MEKNSGIRTAKLEYLQHHTSVVLVMNDKDEIELKPTNDCKRGDIVWSLEANNTFTKTKVC